MIISASNLFQSSFCICNDHLGFQSFPIILFEISLCSLTQGQNDWHIAPRPPALRCFPALPVVASLLSLSPHCPPRIALPASRPLGGNQELPGRGKSMFGQRHIALVACKDLPG